MRSDASAISPTVVAPGFDQTVVVSGFSRTKDASVVTRRADMAAACAKAEPHRNTLELPGVVAIRVAVPTAIGLLKVVPTLPQRNDRAICASFW